MESADNDCTSIFIEPVDDSNLSAGLDAAHYYLGKSVKHSTRQQVRICVYDNKPCHGFKIIFYLVQYDKMYGIWRNFCHENKLSEFGADHKPLAACLFLVMMQDESYSKAEMLRAAIANEYRVRMLPSPTVHETISLLFRGFINAHPHQRKAKQPITEEI